MNDATNGHLTNGQPPEPRPIAFQLRSGEVVTLRPERGAFHPIEGEWAIGGQAQDGVCRYYKLAEILMFFGIPSLDAKSPRHNSDGTLMEAKP